MKLLTKEQKESYEKAKFCSIYKKQFKYKYTKDKKYRKIRDHGHYADEYRGLVHNIYNVRQSATDEIQWVLL